MGVVAFKLQEGGDDEHEKGGCLSVYLRMMLLFFYSQLFHESDGIGIRFSITYVVANV